MIAGPYSNIAEAEIGKGQEWEPGGQLVTSTKARWPVLSMADAILWQSGENLLYKHGIVTYGENMVDLIGVASCSRW
jgi:hypothetical protein